MKEDRDMMKVSVTHTDTFGGEANFGFDGTMRSKKLVYNETFDSFLRLF